MSGMTDEMFAQWTKLVFHIVGYHFERAYRAGAASGDEGQVVRLLERDDLLQEGRLALLEAWRDYKTDHTTKAKFITYAYTCIYWKVFRFVCNNRSPVSMRGWQKDFRSTDTMCRSRFAAALACHLFSESDVDDTSPAPETLIVDYREQELTDFEDHCLEKLRDNLVAKDVSTLLHRSNGRTYAEIGNLLDCSRETARKVVKRLLEEAKTVLKDENHDDF